MLKSLDQFTQTAHSSQSIFAGLVFEDIATNLLKPKLNEWAQADCGIEAKMVAATAGYQIQGLLTFEGLAATLNEAGNPHGPANLIIPIAKGIAVSARLTGGNRGR